MIELLQLSAMRPLSVFTIKLSLIGSGQAMVAH
jgi:hypothetical protein